LAALDDRPITGALNPTRERKTGAFPLAGRGQGTRIGAATRPSPATAWPSLISRPVQA